MVNSEDFAQRLQKIIAYYDLSAASFADKIDVGRSSISHILSGRNKPSLDFVLKVINSFPEVELYWLLNGKGNFPTQENKTETSTSTLKTTTEPEEIETSKKPPEEIISSRSSEEIHKIIIFYKDGSFEAFENKS